MKPNLAVSIYARSSIKFLHFVPFGLQTWPPRLILFSDWITRIALGGHIFGWNGMKWRNFIEDL
jgi:hypothetical protein